MPIQIGEVTLTRFDSYDSSPEMEFIKDRVEIRVDGVLQHHVYQADEELGTVIKLRSSSSAPQEGIGLAKETVEGVVVISLKE